MADAPRVEGLAHLRRIIVAETERAKREGVGCLYLDGCVRAEDRALVDEQVRLVLAGDPACRLVAAQPTADGYAITVGRVAGSVPDEAGAADPLLPD